MSSLTNNELDAPPWLRVESTLMATARLLRDAFDARLAELGLNLTQASLLGYVDEFGSSTQKRLGDRLGIGRAAIGSVVDRLERLGLVERHPDPGDRRVWLVDVTDAGREIARRVTEIDEILRGELRHGIGREERQALSWVLTRLQVNLTAAIARTDPATDAVDDHPAVATPGARAVRPTPHPHIPGEPT
ncbi:MarR family winged helix-turn-helix transcriptional regulator [Ilumatobacter sp.]|uniref:MarR family winged helix-turn-helix transcriptional regulator n=1 Tax=Ilumatobacter sp. TaxID=1967498 RepID=UPI003B521E5F